MNVSNVDILIEGYKNLRHVTNIMNNGKVDTNNINKVYQLYKELKITDERLDFRYEESKFYILYNNIILEVTEELGMTYSYFFSVLDNEYILEELNDIDVGDILTGNRDILTDMSNMSIGNFIETLIDRVEGGKSQVEEVMLIDKALNEYQTVWDICYKGKEQDFANIRGYFKEMTKDYSKTKIKIKYGSVGVCIINKRYTGKAVVEPYIDIYEGDKVVYEDLYMRDMVDIVNIVADNKRKRFRLTM